MCCTTQHGGSINAHVLKLELTTNQNWWRTRQVSFDQPERLAHLARDQGAEARELLRQAWDKSRKLQPGSLVALWFEPDGT